jgi:hypothetical protein
MQSSRLSIIAYDASIPLLVVAGVCFFFKYFWFLSPKYSTPSHEGHVVCRRCSEGTPCRLSMSLSLGCFRCILVTASRRHWTYIFKGAYDYNAHGITPLGYSSKDNGLNEVFEITLTMGGRGLPIPLDEQDVIIEIEVT